MSEEWRDIPGHEGMYQVSNHGRVRSLTRDIVDSKGVTQCHKGCILKPLRHTGGYHRVVISRRGGKRRSYYIHHLVLLAFVGPRPIGCEVAHDDGNKTNNGLQNLRYATHAENEQDKLRHGTRLTGGRHWNAKLSEDDVRKIREQHAGGNRSQRSIATEWGISFSQTCNIINRRIWKHVK